MTSASRLKILEFASISSPPVVIALNKPCGVLCQFTDAGGRPTLSDHVRVADVYPAGRLDQDSEGLLLLTNHGGWQAAIASPSANLWKRYLVQIEREPDEGTLDRLRAGVPIDGGTTLPARARLVTEPDWLWPRDPPIRYRKTVPTAWLELEIHEGRNRQVRRMTAAVGHPALRLIRVAIGGITLSGLTPGEWRVLRDGELARLKLPAASRSPQSRRYLHRRNGRE